MSRTIYITGFEPFGGKTVNASWEAVRLLPEELFGWHVLKERLPVIYGLAGNTVLRTAEAAKPSAILCAGVASGRAGITPEMIAVNLRSATIADNAGYQPSFERIDPDGPDGIFSTLPVAGMTEAVRRSGLPASISFSAGTFVCNDLFYILMRRFRNAGIPCGFIHVPPLGVLDPESCRDGLSLCIQTVIHSVENQSLMGGLE